MTLINISFQLEFILRMVNQNNKKLLPNILITLMAILFFTSGCGITDQNDITKAGLLRVWISFDIPDNYPVIPGDSLMVQARDFRIFNGNYYTDVYQHPEQFLPSEFGLVITNFFDKELEGKHIQVAHGAIPPVTYDRFLFQLSPADWLWMNNKRFPLRSIRENTKTLVEIEETFVVKENKTTNVYLNVDIEKSVYRLLDEFVFNATIDSVRIEIE